MAIERRRMPCMSEVSGQTSQQSAGTNISHQSGGSNIKETIESIVVAFILAFIFRAFVVEAFVIPTGSMAPTLDGAHMRYRCPDCGYVFDVNYQSADQDDMSVPPEALPQDDVYCPNCAIRAGPLRRPHPRPEIRLSAESAAALGCRRLQGPRQTRRLPLHPELHQAPRRRTR